MSGQTQYLAGYAAGMIARANSELPLLHRIDGLLSLIYHRETVTEQTGADVLALSEDVRRTIHSITGQTRRVDPPDMSRLPQAADLVDTHRRAWIANGFGEDEPLNEALQIVLNVARWANRAAEEATDV